MSTKRDNKPPGSSGAHTDTDRQDAGTEEANIISVKKFTSPKGNVYRIIKTNEVDEYLRPPKPRKE